MVNICYRMPSHLVRCEENDEDEMVDELAGGLLFVAALS